MKKNYSLPDEGLSGPGIATIIQIVFLVLKLTKLIDWSWWWVLSPLWISLGVTVILLVIFMIIMNKHRKG